MKPPGLLDFFEAFAVGQYQSGVGIFGRPLRESSANIERETIIPGSLQLKHKDSIGMKIILQQLSIWSG